MTRWILVALIVLVSTALAHEDGPGSWINNQHLRDPKTGEHCCNLHDCQEEVSKITAVERGYHIKATGEIIPTERVIWKSPGGWWRCRYMTGAGAGMTRCLIGPPPSG